MSLVGPSDRGSRLVGAGDEGAPGIDFLYVLIQIVGKIVTLDASTRDLHRRMLAARSSSSAVMA
jgi:hypothetical protein